MTSVRPATVAALALILAACGAKPTTSVPATPASGPSAAASVRPAPTAPGPPILGIDWGRTTAIERPAEAFEQPAPGVSIASEGTGRSGHPQHFPGQAVMADVTRLASGGLVCVGYVYPGWHPTAWTSPADGSTWTLRDMGTTEFTFPVSVAAGEGPGRTGAVAVGRSGSRPLAWTSPDGRTWTSHPVATLGDGTIAERMTAVIATPEGFLAGGSLGPELFERHARFWQSADGVTWTPVPDDAAVFANAEVRAIVPFGSGYVAVGIVGTAQKAVGSVAWTSPDGRAWTRIDAPDLALGRAVALVAAPFGGLVAVGSGLNEEEAFAWTSPDGRSWTLAPSEPSRQYPGKVRMTDVVVVGDAVIGLGNYVGMQRGTAISWVTHDGTTWQKARSAPVQEQAEIYAAIAAGPGLVAVGSVGAPDDYIPMVLLSPGR
jgi:hypothetical protein